MAGTFTRAPFSAVITDQNGFTINLGSGSGSFTQAPQSIVITDANGATLSVGSGPAITTSLDLTAQAANVSTTTLYAVPSTSGGWYRVVAYIVITQAATTSSTLPAMFLSYTDLDTNVMPGVTQLSQAGNTSNTVGTTGFGGGWFCTAAVRVKASTNISVLTTGYASVGATPMQFAAHFRLEYLGA